MSKISVTQHISAFILISVLGFACYSNSFDASFHFDDYAYIVNKKEIRDLKDIRSLFYAIGHPSRFITFWTFAVNYHFHRFDVFGYHVVNWLIHLINGFLVYGLILLIGRLPKIRDELTIGVYPLALFTALLFLVHPLQTEAVTYIVQRFTSLATLFYLLAVICYLKGRLTNGKGSLIFYAGFCIATVLGMFSKQICFTVPITVLFMEMLFISSSMKDGIQKNWKLLIVPALLLLIIPSFFQFNWSGIIGREYMSRSHEPDIINTKTYFLTQSRVIPTYIRLLFFPIGQTLDYDFPVSNNLFEPKVILGFLFLIALVGTAIICRRKYRLITFGIGWFFITLSVTSTIIPIPHVIFEHHMYLPSVGLILVISFLMLNLVKKHQYLLISVLICVLGVLTFQRNMIWKTDINLWTDIVKKAPNKVRVWNNLGMAYLEQGEFSKSIDCFNQALVMNDNAVRVYNNRGLAYASLNQDDEALADFDQAAALYQHAPADYPDLTKKVWAEIFYNRGNLFFKQKKIEKAVDDFNTGLKIDPDNERILYNLGYIYESNQQFELARQYYERSIQANPEFSRAYIGLGFVDHEFGKNEQAMQNYSLALKLDPQNSEALFYRAIVLYELGRKGEAQKDMQQSLDLGFETSSAELMAVRNIILNMN